MVRLRCPGFVLLARAGSRDCAERLLAAGANIADVTDRGKTAAQIAEAGGHADLAEWLLTRQAETVMQENSHEDLAI